MRNAIILGAGRSGTSLLAGLFQKSGYFYGTNLLPPTDSNPLGYFEDVEINNINECLIAGVAPWKPRGIAGTLWPLHRDRPRHGQRWLSTLPPGTAVKASPRLDARMVRQTSNRPYLFKDPRFSYTLEAWSGHLAPDTTYLCVFREPQRTVNSILKNIRDEPYLRDLKFGADNAYHHWEAVYRAVLYQRTAVSGDWLFVHYDEIINEDVIELVEDHLGAVADKTVLRPELRRSSAKGTVSESVAKLYKELQQLAEQKY